MNEAALNTGPGVSPGLAGRTTDDALAAADEAIARFRKLAAADPAYRTMLAAVLLQSGELLARVPRPAEAIARCEDSVARYRMLITEDPALLPQFAAALAGLGDVLHRGGRLREALAVTEEAENVHASLRAVDLLAFVKAAPQHAELTHHRARLLAEVGNHQEALTVAEHAVADLRRLVPFAPQARTPRLATALLTLGGRLHHVGRTAEAITVTEEAVDLYRSPAASRARLATSVHTLGSLLAAAERTADAEPLLTEALEHHRRLAESDPSQWLPHVAKALHDLRALTVRAQVAWSTRREIDRLARQLRRRRDRTGLWELTIAVPVADAARIARRLPRRWNPPDPTAAPLFAKLRAARPRALAGAARSTGRRAVVRTHDPIHSARQLSFAPTGPLLTLITAPDAGTDRVHLLDTTTGQRTLLYSGPAGHGSFTTLPSGEVVAIRTPWLGRSAARAVQAPRHGPWELVQYAAGRTERLGSGPLFDGARAVAIDDGYVIGLRPRSAALLGHPGAPLRRVDLASFGLGRGDVVAADPTGTRLAFADGPSVVLTDSALTTALARGTAPPDHGHVEELVFVSSDELVSVGDRGSVFLWQVVDGRLLVVAATEKAPRLRHLFAVPSWRTVGGWAPGEQRAHCYETATLTPRDLPRPSPRPPLAVAASSDGRRLAYATGGGFGRKNKGAALTVHDLLHPSAVWERPLAALTTAELEPSWGAVQSLPPDQRELLLLTRAAVEHRGTVRTPG
ncbi:tetratricopeptide repeat protein [Streptomyces sp. NPDC005963]|uniref:tetratricopeptide repeat protein n=1 Tax=Streptomyces sp. NPDC005963 TaxID=3156721 RepID=UPI0033C10DD8